MANFWMCAIFCCSDFKCSYSFSITVYNDMAFYKIQKQPLKWFFINISKLWLSGRLDTSKSLVFMFRVLSPPTFFTQNALGLDFCGQQRSSGVRKRRGKKVPYGWTLPEAIQKWAEMAVATQNWLFRTRRWMNSYFTSHYKSLTLVCFY